MKPRVVVAHYDPNILEEREALFQDLDVELVPVRNGLEAVQTACEQPCAMVLMDPMLPGLSGFDAAGRIHREMPQVPIVMVTSVYKGMVYRNEALNRYGASEYIEEPVERETIRSVIRKYLKPKQSQTPSGSGPKTSRTDARPISLGTRRGRSSTRRRLEAILREAGLK